EAKRYFPEEPVIDFALAELLFSIGQENRAIPFYEKIYKETSEINQVSILERLAESHASIGHYETALTYYEQLDSDNTDILFRYGFTAFKQDKNDVEIRVCRQLIDIVHCYQT